MTIWSNGDNATWKTDKPIVCDICNRKSDDVMQFSNNQEDFISACFRSQRRCFIKAVENIDKWYPNREFVWVRGVELVNFRGKSSKPREPVGLSKRYKVLKRDGFQCIYCGASGKNSKLEVDHIVPVSAGGSSKMDNLQTLCFQCNRGKSDNG